MEEGFMGLSQGFLPPSTPAAVPRRRANRSGVEAAANNAEVGPGESVIDLNKPPSELGLDDDMCLDDWKDLFPEELLSRTLGRRREVEVDPPKSVADDQTGKFPISEPIDNIPLNQEKHREGVFTSTSTYTDAKSDSQQEAKSRKRKNTDDAKLKRTQGRKPKKSKVWPRIKVSQAEANMTAKNKTRAGNHSTPNTPKVRTPKKKVPSEKRRAAKPSSTEKVRNGDKFPELVPKTCKRALNFDLPNYDVGKSDHQYESRDKELAAGSSPVTGSVAESRHCPETVVSLIVYQRKFKGNDCQGNSRKVGPNFPRICKKVRTMNRRARSISSFITKDGKARNRKQASYGSMISVKSRKKKRLRTQSNKKSIVARSIANDLPGGFRSCKPREINPRTRAHNQATARDQMTFDCLLYLPPITKQKKKRSYRLIRKHYTGLPEKFHTALPSFEGLKDLSIGGLPYNFQLPSALANRVDNLPIRGGLQDRYPVASAVKRNSGSSFRGLSDETMVPRAITEASWKLPLACDELISLNQTENGTNEATFETTKSLHISGKEQHMMHSGGFNVEGNEAVKRRAANSRRELIHLDPNAVVIGKKNKTNKKQEALVPFKPKKDDKKEKLPQVDVDPETMRVWKLQLINLDYKVEDDGDADTEKYWEKERNLFSGRVNAFINMMHGILGDRRFSPWKASVMDSVVGVFLTQNVSDHLSSNAFLNLAARFPVKPAAYNYQRKPIEVERIAWSPALYGNYTEAQSSDACGSEDGRSSNSNENSVSSSPIPDDKQEKERRCFKILCDSVKINALSQMFSECSLAADDEPELTMGQGSMRDPAGLQTGTPEKKKNAEKKQEEPEKTDRAQQGRVCSTTLLNSVDTEEASLLSSSHECSSKDGLELTMGQCSMRDPVDLQTGSPEKEKNLERKQENSPIPEKEGRVQQEGVCSNTFLNSIRKDASLLSNSHKCSSKDGLELTMGQSSIIDHPPDNLQKKSTKKKKQEDPPINWDDLRKKYGGRTSKATSVTRDCVDWEGVRRATLDEVAGAIKGRGQHYILAKRIQECLNRVAQDHEGLDLEWLRDVPPAKAKEYLLSINGLGLKSVECLRLLSLFHHAFPVDTNVGRVAVRLGWVPLIPLPDSLQLHLLEQYPLLDKIQVYLWPRLRHLDEATLFSLHYHMISFGKVFCTKKSPNCHSCPLKGDCKHYASQEARPALPWPQEKHMGPQEKHMENNNTLVPVPVAAAASSFANAATQFFREGIFPEHGNRTKTCEPIIEYPDSDEGELETDIEDLGCMIGHRSEYPERGVEDVGCNIEDDPIAWDLQLNLSSENVELPKALVPLYGSKSAPKWKEINRLRTVIRVYELPDDHLILQALQMEKRDPLDFSPYLLVPWFSGEGGTSNNNQNQGSETVPCTILIPLRTATRGTFPLSGTYFQINEVFADFDTSENPIDVPREYLCRLQQRQRTVCCGAFVAGMFKGMSLEGIKDCFGRGSICVRAFNRRTRVATVLSERFHISTTSKNAKGKKSTTPPNKGKKRKNSN